MPSYNSYINAAGASTSVVEPNNDWNGFYSNNKVVDEKLYAEGKSVNTYANAAPVVVRMPSRDAVFNRRAQNTVLASQNRIMEQQRQWNEAWAKRVAEMEQEEDPKEITDVRPVNPDEIVVPGVLKLNDAPVKNENTATDNLGAGKPAAPENVDEEDNFKANYPYEQIEVGLYGAAAEMSDDEFLANVEAAENENIEEYAQPLVDETDDDLIGYVEAPKDEDIEEYSHPEVEEDVMSFNETPVFKNNEQDEFAEHGAVTFDDDDDDVISFDEPATVESVEVSFENGPVVDEDEEDVVPEPVVVKEAKKRGRPAGKTVSATKKKTTTAKKTTATKKK